MTLPAPTYDLVLLIDPQVDDATRAKIVTDAQASIEAQGELLRHDGWGERAMTYPIEKKANAEYHLLQFHAGTPELVDGLSRTLRITDGVLRFRIIKLKPGVPDAPDMVSAAAPPRRAEPDAPVDETPVDETPVDETPVDETPAAETPAAETPPEQPAAEMALAEPTA
jgi:small subunit ribosomal protein S6